MDAVTIVGLLAALASMTSFSPQAWKIIKSGNSDGLSAVAYSITVLAFALWIAYGVMLGQWPLIVSNGVCLILSGFILVMTMLPRRETHEVAAKLDPSPIQAKEQVS